MPLIKRYANRKLYNTETKQYITLDGIADLIRAGTEVQVLDHETGDDLTAVIQSQIIFEQEKKLRGGQPRAVFNDLLRAGNDTLARLRHAIATRAWKAEVDAEIERRLLALIQAGEMTEDEGMGLLEKLVPPETAATAAAAVPEDNEVQRLLKQLDVPRRADLQKLMAQIETLNAEVSALSATARPPRAKTPRAKTTRSRTA